MKLTARLWLLGAVVPFVGTILSLYVAGHVFRAKLEGAVDDALLGQAAVEAVSLFDGPEGNPHLHMQRSPLSEAVKAIAPAAALYHATGELELRYPKDADAGWTRDVLLPESLPAGASLETVRLPDGRRIRRVSAAVRDPNGIPHALQLAASLGNVDVAVAEFHRTGVMMAMALGAGLLVLQSFLARRLRTRVTALTAHMAALREGQLDRVLPRTAGSDEIAELSRVVGEATEKLRRARSAQDRLVADAAHELRTPLTLMRTSIDLALRRRREVPELVASLEETRREVDRLARLSTRLLDLAAAGRGAWDRVPGDLVRVATEAAEAIRGAAEEKGVLVQVAATGPVEAKFDPHGIRQAIDNLLANACRFGPPGSTITIEVAAAGGRDAVGENGADGIARLAVQDEGPGFPPGDRERLFEPFQHGERRGGAGLGLAIVREIARGHGGRAYVADAPRGARVVIEMPRAR